MAKETVAMTQKAVDRQSSPISAVNSLRLDVLNSRTPCKAPEILDTVLPKNHAASPRGTKA